MKMISLFQNIRFYLFFMAPFSFAKFTLLMWNVEPGGNCEPGLPITQEQIDGGFFSISAEHFQ